MNTWTKVSMLTKIRNYSYLSLTNFKRHGMKYRIKSMFLSYRKHLTQFLSLNYRYNWILNTSPRKTKYINEKKSFTLSIKYNETVSSEHSLNK